MRILFASALIALAGLSIGLGTAQDPAAPPGVQVEARGPVHEAFAAPTVREPEAAPVIPKKPPEAIEELPPETRPEGTVWIPGYWAWDEEGEEFLWVSGLWRLPPPQRTWLAGYWREVDGGWQRVSGYWAVEAQQQIEVWPTPPEAVPEAIPPAPEADVIYVPGCWVYVETRYWWRPGYWVRPRPGWVYVYPSYVWTPAGCVFVDGHWDYDFHHCGVLFAPVRIDVRLIRPGWVYRPHYCVPADFFVRALFVRPHWRHYYFGDFYDARYARLGFRPWVDYRVAGRVSDPHFAYYRWHNRSDPRWDENLRQVYVARQEGTMARPPRTLNQQQNTEVKVVVPIKQMASPALRFQNVSKTQMQEVQQTANLLRASAFKRGTIEVNTAASVKKSGAGAAPVKIEVPVPKLAVKPPESAKPPPPPPTVPKPTASPPPKAKDDKPPKVDPGKVDPGKLPLPPPPLKTKDDKPKVDPPKLPAAPPPKGKDDKPKVDPDKLPLPPKGKDDKPPKVEPPKVDPPKLPAVPPPKGKDDKSNLEPPPKPPKVELPKPPPPPPPKVDPPKPSPPPPPPKVEPKPPPPPPKVDPPKPPPLPPPPKVDPPKPPPPPPPKVEPPKGKEKPPPPPPPKKKDDKKKDDKKDETPPDQSARGALPARVAVGIVMVSRFIVAARREPSF